MIGFKYLGATCSAEVCIRIASAMAILNRIWQCNTISFISKFKLCKSVVTSILLYDCETWTCSLTLEEDPGFRNQLHEETSPYLLLGAQDQRLGAEQIQLPCRSTGTSSGSCQETETGIVRTCHAPRQPLQNHPSGHLGGWATPWSAEEMLDGQYQTVDIPAHARTAHNGLPRKRPEEDLC